MSDSTLRVLSVLILSASASAQITPIGAFVGAQQEEFETLLNNPVQCIPGRVFNNHGDLCTPLGPYCIDTFGWLLYCAIYPHNGSNGLFGSAQGPADFTFDTPAQRFGGYFGTNGYLAGGVADFYDAGDNLIAFHVPVTAPNCAWAWNGWDAGSGPKIKRVELFANDPYNQGGLLQMDDMEYDPAGAASPGTDMCQPGTGTVIACPCGNPATSVPSGCDNSSATGGAVLMSIGDASLAADTVVFTTDGEKPTALSILMQGTTFLPNGVVYGQGVRCVGGNLKRLYVKHASGGAITAPSGGDLPVSARSAAMGNPILSGSLRYYGVYYRDPTVLFGCPATSTFNITQTQGILWGP